MKAIFTLIFLGISSVSFATVRVALFDVPPFSYINKKGELDGLVYKLCKKIEKESGMIFSYTLVPYARAVKLLKNGEVDLGIFYPSNEYKSDFIELVPTLGNVNYLISKKPLKINSITEIADAKIALLRGAKYFREFDDLKKPGEVSVQDYNMSLNMLLLNRVDLAVVSSAAFEYFLRKNNIKKEKVFNTFTLNRQTNWIHVTSKMNSSTREKLIKANLSVINKGNYKDLTDLFD